MKNTFIHNFQKIKNNAECIKMQHEGDFALQFEILGEGSGIFYIEYKGGRLSIEPYDYHDHSARLQATAPVFCELLSGEITINDALRFGDINIISKRDDGVKNTIAFFDTCYNIHKVAGSYMHSTGINQKAMNPWDSLRIYIEQSDIDTESKNQLLANLVRFTSNELHILIVGGCGCGKSSTINALFNMELAQVGYGVDAQTQHVSAYKLDNLYLHDTPGLGESTAKDRQHMELIKATLQETDSEGNALIDVVLVIIDGSYRDMKSSFELINDVVIPNMQHKDRILIGINRCDLALNGQGWIEKYNYPNEELLQRLQEKADSVRRRIREDTGVDVEPVFYSALYKYNISKLLSYLVKSAPTRKRVFFAEKINKDPGNFEKDDTSVLARRKKDVPPETLALHREVDLIRSTITGLERKFETLHTDIKAEGEKFDSPNKYSKGPIHQRPQKKQETPDDVEEYELRKADKVEY